MPTYVFIYGWKLIHVRRDNFEFISWHMLTPEKYHKLRNNSPRVKKWYINILKHYF